MIRQTRHEGLHEEFKRRIMIQTVLPPERVEGTEPAAMSFWVLASGLITIRMIDGWRNLAERPFDKIIDLAA